MTSRASETLSSGDMVMGSTIMPLSERLTLSTSPACCSTVRLRWIMPRPPCWAMAMAMRDSVTVSMAALIRGMFSVMLRERRVWVLTPAGTTSERAGNSRTSSKVRASGTGKWIMKSSGPQERGPSLRSGFRRQAPAPPRSGLAHACRTPQLPEEGNESFLGSQVFFIVTGEAGSNGAAGCRGEARDGEARRFGFGIGATAAGWRLIAAGTKRMDFAIKVLYAYCPRTTWDWEKEVWQCGWGSW